MSVVVDTPVCDQCEHLTVPRMSNDAAVWVTSAANKFREVARGTENPNTKLLAEGLTYLAEAIRVLDAPS